MVGQPKHLSDLARIEADVRITCRECGFEEDWQRDAFARHLFALGASQVWSEITRALRCRRFGCGSTNLRAAAVPFARRAANMPRRVGRLDAHLLDTAMKVLEQAVHTSRGRAVATLELRLALLVVYRYSHDRDGVRHFWQRASAADRTVDDGLVEPLRSIRHRLVQAGWLAPAILVDVPRTWPWNSPPPSGWLVAEEDG
ncbi:hypothetical protein [Sphingomonas aerophila]|jgi:hypothetical protein|uniref:Uncharacterized protein n=1 Tax=Sphingomonas aerophila TaxID=1344948 RepID=A0A7W9BB21_9SPHN|nr:hypothetical protein [Sphingomonas aerophila]MBB5713883.1 hypothetical protein [Sphingomonas aerophila]